MVFLLLTNNFFFNTFKSSQSRFLSFRYWPRFRTDRGRSGEQVGHRGRQCYGGGRSSSSFLAYQKDKRRGS